MSSLIHYFEEHLNWAEQRTNTLAPARINPRFSSRGEIVTNLRAAPKQPLPRAFNAPSVVCGHSHLTRSREFKADGRRTLPPLLLQNKVSCKCKYYFAKFDEQASNPPAWLSRFKQSYPTEPFTISEPQNSPIDAFLTK